jgi:hypothetical protein
MPLPAPRSYFQEALFEQAHGLFLVPSLFLVGGGLLTFNPFFILMGMALEGGYLLIAPRRASYRRRVDARWAMQARADQQGRWDLLTRKLPDNAQARLRTLTLGREQVLTQLAASPQSQALQALWAPRLDALVDAGLELLLAIAAVPPAAQAAAQLQADADALEKELAQTPPGPAHDARTQRLEHLRRQLAAGAASQQRDAAIVQYDMLEDLIRELQGASLAGRDVGSFSAELEKLRHLIEAARQSQAALMPMIAEPQRLLAR